jgi:hypothetical protein
MDGHIGPQRRLPNPLRTALGPRPTAHGPIGFQMLPSGGGRKPPQISGLLSRTHCNFPPRPAKKAQTSLHCSGHGRVPRAFRPAPVALAGHAHDPDNAQSLRQMPIREVRLGLKAPTAKCQCLIVFGIDSHHRSSSPPLSPARGHKRTMFTTIPGVSHI